MPEPAANSFVPLRTIYRWHYRATWPSEDELLVLSEQARETPEHLAKKAERLYVVFVFPGLVAGGAVALAPVWLAVQLLSSHTVNAAAAVNVGAQVVIFLVVASVAAGSFVLLIPAGSSLACYLWVRIVLRRQWANHANVEAMIRTAEPYFE